MRMIYSDRLILLGYGITGGYNLWSVCLIIGEKQGMQTKLWETFGKRRIVSYVGCEDSMWFQVARDRAC